jgi:exosome complex component RRP4
MEASSLRFSQPKDDSDMQTDNAAAAHLKIVVPGEYIAEGAGLTAGHGTFESKDAHDEEDEANERPLGYAKIYASVAGVVHKIDNWIGVKPLKQGYKPDVGDVVVARIVAVQKSSWSCDVNSYQHAVLNLTSISLPSGEQRRRSEEDQLAMRTFFRENEIISAEV